MSLAEDHNAVTTGKIVLADALKAVADIDTLLHKAKQVVRAKVVQDGRISSRLIEAEQRATHGLAWFATYAESLREMTSLHKQAVG